MSAAQRYMKEKTEWCRKGLQLLHGGMDTTACLLYAIDHASHRKHGEEPWACCCCMPIRLGGGEEEVEGARRGVHDWYVLSVGECIAIACYDGLAM